MLRGLTSWTAVCVVMLAGAWRGGASHARPVREPLYHSHTHYHGGHEHTHWHSHGDEAADAAPNPADDHHESIGDHEHDDAPVPPAPTRTSQGRDESGKLFVTCYAGSALFQVNPRPQPPRRPPPTIETNAHLQQLRTVVLLT